MGAGWADRTRLLISLQKWALGVGCGMGGAGAQSQAVCGVRGGLSARLQELGPLPSLARD